MQQIFLKHYISSLYFMHKPTNQDKLPGLPHVEVGHSLPPLYLNPLRPKVNGELIC